VRVSHGNLPIIPLKSWELGISSRFLTERAACTRWAPNSKAKVFESPSAEASPTECSCRLLIRRNLFVERARE
jgi:hypothetical protein